VRVSYRQSAADDIVRQFRYYLVAKDLPEVAVRFLEAVRRTVEQLRRHPHLGPRYHTANSQLQNLRSWPVTGFEAIRVYYVPDEEILRVVRILHGKRDVKRIIASET
jgi:plasmid stabilization system protein ParE